MPFSEAGSSEGFVLLRLVREAVDVYGNVREEVEQGRLALPGEALLPPRGHQRADRWLETGARKHDGFTVYRISGSLRPSVVLAGEREDYRSIPLPEVVIRVMPRNFEPIAKEPLTSLRKALTKQAPVHLLVAAELLPAGDRPAAIETLVEALRVGAGPMERSILASLRRIAPVELPLDPGAWCAWWDDQSRSSSAR
jgi:hypothetical protein